MISKKPGSRNSTTDSLYYTTQLGISHCKSNNNNASSQLCMECKKATLLVGYMLCLKESECAAVERISYLVFSWSQNLNLNMNMPPLVDMLKD